MPYFFLQSFKAVQHPTRRPCTTPEDSDSNLPDQARVFLLRSGRNLIFFCRNKAFIVKTYACFGVFTKTIDICFVNVFVYFTFKLNSNSRIRVYILGYNSLSFVFCVELVY